MFTIKQLVRYGLVGVMSNLIMYFIYLLITYFGVEHKVAMTLIYLFGASFGFISHRNWTFSFRGTFSGATARYAIAHLFGYMLNFLILYVGVDYLGYAHQWVQVGAIIMVSGFLFTVFKYFVFHERFLR